MSFRLGIPPVNETSPGDFGVLALLAVSIITQFLLIPSVQAMSSLSKDELSDVSGQEGIAMDLHLSSSFSIGELQYIDDDGVDGDKGIVGLHNINPESAMDLEGLTLDADGATTVGGNVGGALVFNLPDVNSGIRFSMVPGGDDESFSKSITSGTSLGSVGMGDISSGGTRVEVAGN